MTKEQKEAMLFTIKVERSGAAGRRTELYQSPRVTIDNEGLDRTVTWWDTESRAWQTVTVSHEGQADARVVYIENSVGATTQVVRPRR